MSINRRLWPGSAFVVSSPSLTIHIPCRQEIFLSHLHTTPLLTMEGAAKALTVVGASSPSPPPPGISDDFTAAS